MRACQRAAGDRSEESRRVDVARGAAVYQWCTRHTFNEEDEMTLTLYSPRAEKFLDASARVQRAWDGSLKNKRVAFVDNGRPNALKILEMIEKRLVENYQVTPRWVHKIDHSSAGTGGWTVIPVLSVEPGLPDEVDVAINGVGN